MLLIHAGNWNIGSPFDLVSVGNEIAGAGYFVVGAFYEAGASRTISQTSPATNLIRIQAWFPNERMVNDIKALVRALRDDPRCKDGKVGVVGGSAGANFAVTVALDKNPSPAV